MLLSLSFFPKVEKPNSKTGKIPMYLRITFNRKKAEMRLNVEINQQELSKWDEVTMRFADRSMTANAYLNSIEKGFEDFKYHNASKLNTYNHSIGID